MKNYTDHRYSCTGCHVVRFSRWAHACTGCPYAPRGTGIRREGMA